MLQAADEAEPPEHALPPTLRQATPAPHTRAPRIPADQPHETKQMRTAAAEQAQQTADLWKLDEKMTEALQKAVRAGEAWKDYKTAFSMGMLYQQHGELKKAIVCYEAARRAGNV